MVCKYNGNEPYKSVLLKDKQKQSFDVSFEVYNYQNGGLKMRILTFSLSIFKLQKLKGSYRAFVDMIPKHAIVGIETTKKN